MRKIYLLCLTTFLCVSAFAQYSVDLIKQEYNGSYYYQGELKITSYKDSETTGYLPEVNTVTKITFTNLSTTAYIGELKTNIVDRAAVASYWTELNSEYATVTNNFAADDILATGVTRMHITQTAESPKLGEYSLVFQAWNALEGVDTVTIKFESLSLAQDATVQVYFADYPQSTYNIIAGNTTDLSSRVKYSYLQKATATGYPQWSSSDETIAKVDSTGVVTGVAAGTATITLKEVATLLTDVTVGDSTYSAGKAFIWTAKTDVTVRAVPDISIPWNQQGMDIEGIGYYGESDEWQANISSVITDALETHESGLSTTYKPTEGDVFTIHIAGKANYSGTIEFGLVDERAEVNYWAAMSEFAKGYTVTKGEDFDFTITLPITTITATINGNTVDLASPSLIIPFKPTIGSCIGKENNIELTLSTYEVTYTPLSESAVPYVDSPITLCQGSTATALSATGADGAVFTWYNSEKTALSEAPIPSTENTDTTLYYVSQKVGENPESELVEVSVIVLPKTKAPTVDTTEQSVCAGTSASFVATSDNSVEWINSSNVVVTTDKTLTQREMVAGTRTFAVYAVSYGACNSDTIGVTLNLLAGATISISGNSEAVVGEEVTYTAQSDSTFTIDSWKINDIAEEETSATLTTKFTSSGTYSIAVTATDDKGCSSSGYKAVSVSATAKAEEPSVTSTALTYCQGDEIPQLTATASEGATLVWYDAANTKLSAAPTPSSEYSGTTTYYVSQTQDSLDESNKVAITVTINAIPTISVTTPTSAAYTNTEVTFTASSSVTGGSFAWIINDTDEGSEEVSGNSSSKSYTFDKEGQQTILVSQTISETGCKATTTLSYKIKDFPTITFDEEEYSVNTGETITLTPTYKNIDNKSQVTWTPDYSLFQITANSEDGSATLSPINVGSGKVAVTVNYYDSETGQTIYPTDTCIVTVVNPNAPVISFDNTAIDIYVSQTGTIKTTYTNMPETTGIWTMAGTGIISFVSTSSSELQFRADAIGEETITYSVDYTDPTTYITTKVSASCKVVVTKLDEKIVCSVHSVEMYVGEKTIIDALVQSISTNTYSIELSDSSKVEVVDRMLTALEPGEVDAYAICDGNKNLKDTVHILVKEFIYAKEISMPKQVTIKEGSDTTLVPTVIPSNASYTDVVFLEKDDDVITVTADGHIYGKAAGTSIVTASTKEGLQAQTLIYVTSSEDEIVKIRLNNGCDSVFLKVGETKTISCQVSPTTIKANDLIWASANSEIADVSSSGVLTAKKVGEMFLYISYKTLIDEKIKVFVTNSVAPTITYIPTVQMQQPGSAVTLDLANYISDDSTSLADLKISFSENENIAVDLNGTIATISLKNTEYIGTTTITLTVTDEEELATSRDIAIEVDKKPNEAPTIVTESIAIPSGKYAQVIIADMATDDYTPSNELTFSYEDNDNLIIKLLKDKTTMRIYAVEDDWTGPETLQVSFTDAEGNEATKDIQIVAQKIENQAPVLYAIPTQYENDSTLFQTIDLSKYVSDDFTSASNIVWSASTSENVNVIFTGTYAEISDLNEYWRGAEVITFTAMDQGGLTTSMDVTFYRETATTETEKDFGWYGKPTVSIITSRYYGTPGETFTLIGTFYGSNCSGIWDVKGVELEDPNALIQTLTFDTLGYYDVTFTVMYGEGSITKVSDTLGVVGIAERTPSICKGDSQTLTASTGMDSYLWSNGATSQSITVNPAESTDYTLQMKKGLTTFNDTINLRVSIPVQLEKDSVMCAGTTHELVAQGDYESYNWSTGDTTKSIEIPAKVASYTVSTIDDLGCTSTSTFNVTKVNDLPALDLGEDKTLCDKKTLTLDAGTGYTYDWNIQKSEERNIESSEQKITLDSSAYITVKITDDNMCESFDTINVTFTYPYPEEIGVVTYSETSNNVIIAWERTANVNTEKYRVERLDGNSWNTIGEPVLFNEFGIVVDEQSNVDKRAYKYRLITTDGCGNEAMSGEYRSSYLQTNKTIDGKISLEWWTYQSPREGNVIASYLLRDITNDTPSENDTTSEVGLGETTSDRLPGLENYETIDSFEATEDYVGWTDTEGAFKTGDIIRIAYLLDETVYENAIKDEDGNIIEYQETKSESGPFSLAVSNIAEVENSEKSDAIKDLFPADVAVYPTTVTNVVNVAIVGKTYENYTIDVISSNGHIVTSTQTGDITKSLIQIPTEQLSQGLYSVRISTGNAEKTIKIVK